MSRETLDPRRHNRSGNRHLSDLIDSEVRRADAGRRAFLKSGASLAALSMVGSFGAAGFGAAGFGLLSCGRQEEALSNAGAGLPRPLGFDSIAGSKANAIRVPEGYTAQVLAPWGTPIDEAGVDWKADGSNTAEEQAHSMGMHHDGQHFFALDGRSDDGLLCVNHEYLDVRALHPDGPTVDPQSEQRTSADEARKELNGHGLSVIRIRLVDGRWQLVRGDEHNRRITGYTPFDVTGPLGGHEALRTPWSPDGRRTRGTFQNCGCGYTPWGTYLSGEENWPEYYVNHGEKTANQLRIGQDRERTSYGWDHLAGHPSEKEGEFSRFDLTERGASSTEDWRNEAHGVGYVVELDPHDPQSRPAKRTALGRFRHESATLGELKPGRPVVFYTGHDARFEYVYKFVSREPWDPADAKLKDRMAVGSKYMDHGTLFVARFDEGGFGQWLPLTLESPTTDGGRLADHFADLGELILNTPAAADLLGATPMDRPEWLALNPEDGSVFLALTNNSKRSAETGTNPANPRLRNVYGHILRWTELDGDRMRWEVFVYGSSADSPTEINRSGLVESNMFASPDSVTFDPRGILWVLTDNSAEAVDRYTNDQVLAVIPGRLRDTEGRERPLQPGDENELRRFITGPLGAEMTGLTLTPDGRNLFVNVQHPANWPVSDNATEAPAEGQKVRPRSTTVVIRREDGGPVGV